MLFAPGWYEFHPKLEPIILKVGITPNCRCLLYPPLTRLYNIKKGLVLSLYLVILEYCNCELLLLLLFDLAWSLLAAHLLMFRNF